MLNTLATDSLIPTDVSYTALTVETRDYQKCHFTSGVYTIFTARGQ